MTGIPYITEEKGNRISVVIDLQEHGGLREDFYDRIVIEPRKRHTAAKTAVSKANRFNA